MNTAVEPGLGSTVELVDVGGDAVELDLGQERLSQLPERPLDLPFALRVAGLTGGDLHAVMSSERHRGGVQLEPSALRRTQRPHPVRPRRRRDTAERFEHPDEPFEGVVLVLGGGEPPHPLSWPARDRPEAAQRMIPAPPTGDVVEVAEVELVFLARIGVDRHRHRRRRLGTVDPERHGRRAPPSDTNPRTPRRAACGAPTPPTDAGRCPATSRSAPATPRSAPAARRARRPSTGGPCLSHLRIVAGWNPVTSAISTAVQPSSLSPCTSTYSSWFIMSPAVPSVVVLGRSTRWRGRHAHWWMVIRPGGP